VQAIHRITIIAHSMGNRLLADGLRVLANDGNKPYAAKITEIIFAAPDIDATTFCDRVIPLVRSLSVPGTLYASANDWALTVSKSVNGHPRAGDGGDRLLTSTALTTIDASAVDTGLVGHSYYGESKTIVADVFDLLRGKPPEARTGIRAEAKQSNGRCDDSPNFFKAFDASLPAQAPRRP